MTEAETAVAQDALGVVAEWLPGYLHRPDDSFKVVRVLEGYGGDVYRYTPVGDYTDMQPRYFEVRVIVKEVSE